MLHHRVGDVLYQSTLLILRATRDGMDVDLRHRSPPPLCSAALYLHIALRMTPSLVERAVASGLRRVCSGHAAREGNRVRRRVHLLLWRSRRGIRILVGATARCEGANKQCRSAQMS